MFDVNFRHVEPFEIDGMPAPVIKVRVLDHRKPPMPLAVRVEIRDDLGDAAIAHNQVPFETG
jgi:hypothetical protein